MLTKRIIACLDVKDGVVVKGVKFKNHEVVGDILELAQRYRDQGVDELVFYDISASSDGRRVSKKWVEDIARTLNIPFCVAGGIRSVTDAREILFSGADKISINSPAIERPDLINELSEEFGQQCIVVGVDSLRNSTNHESHDYEVYCYTGSESATRKANLKTMDWLKEAQKRGAGEIVLNCMDRDGTASGFDLIQLALARAAISIPLVASGGARTPDDFFQVFETAKVDAALGASAFHSGKLHIQALKQELANRKIEMRL
jgi:cyclase